MPRLTVIISGKERRCAFQPGATLREILEEAGCRVRTACRGHGACGLCEIRLLDGPPPEPTLSERLHIPPERLARGVRLACQVRPAGDMRLEVLHPAPPSAWHSLSREGFPPSAWPPGGPFPESFPEVREPLAAAVDLGTTNIRLALLKLSDGSCLALGRGRNPQASWGADVMTRLVAARENPDTARALRELAVAAVGEGLADLAGRDGIDLKRVASLAVAGNTPMLALLAGKNYELLLQPEHWLSPVDCQPEDPGAWAAAWGLHPRARVRLIPPLAGFVGSDLLAGLAATRLLDGPAPALLLDFGTNSEIALWDGADLWVTSAAGGPAFEMWGLSLGMAAAPGAIRQVARQPGGGLHYRVIGDAEPRGFCGSGLVDLLARLLEDGRLSRKGRFAAGQDRLPVGPGTPRLFLTRNDVDHLQQAKAAIAAGVRTLAGQAGIEPARLRRVCVAGEFGRFLDPASARAIGLLPETPAAQVELMSDAALRGCADLLMSRAANDQLDWIRKTARLINLAQAPDFDELFFTGLFLEPMQEG